MAEREKQKQFEGYPSIHPFKTWLVAISAVFVRFRKVRLLRFGYIQLYILILKLHIYVFNDSTQYHISVANLVAMYCVEAVLVRLCLYSVHVLSIQRQPFVSLYLFLHTSASIWKVAVCCPRTIEIYVNF